jgi:lycopene cyclase domain-containing protein
MLRKSLNIETSDKPLNKTATTVNTHYTYLLIDFLTILFPLALSFYSKANFSKKWKYLVPAIAIPALIFIVWDMAFTRIGVWGFNPRYVSGIYLYNLPIEEIGFFICVPYACVFTYEAVNYLSKRDFLANASPYVSSFLVMFLMVLGLLNTDRWYTGVTFIACAFLIGLHQWKWRSPYLSRFYFSFLFVLLPFFMVNGILTGSLLDEPVVWYNENEFLGFRMGTIPFEDTFYGMLLLLMNITIFESIQQKQIQPAQHGTSYSG